MKINQAFDRCGWKYQAALLGILLAVPVVQSQAQTYNLSTGTTSLQINAGGSNAGLSNWMNGGVNELAQQWFYYSVGGGNVNSIDTINPWSLVSQSGTSLSGTYSDSTLSVTTTYALASAGLTTQVAVQNLSGSTEAFNFYQYSDFGIGGVSAGQDVYFPGSGFPYTVYQYNPNNAGIGYLQGSVDVGIGTTVEEAAGINNGTQLGLKNGNPAPNFTNSSGIVGPGSVNFGYEFTATLAPGSSITFNELQVVPEPSALALISCGILVFGLFSRRGLGFLKS
ncbi:MAG TPA: hypothetical protein VK811_07585 [Candidatus Acidoferrum sp.]|jgi:hypothetical protein|nr:hypothetical protein [Candidatus Acidoferrum sp.]